MNVLSYLFYGQRMNVTALNHSSEGEQAGWDGRVLVQTVTRSMKLLTKEQICSDVFSSDLWMIITCREEADEEEEEHEDDKDTEGEEDETEDKEQDEEDKEEEKEQRKMMKMKKTKTKKEKKKIKNKREKKKKKKKKKVVSAYQIIWTLKSPEQNENDLSVIKLSVWIGRRMKLKPFLICELFSDQICDWAAGIRCQDELTLAGTIWRPPPCLPPSSGIRRLLDKDE